ncbi:MAG: NAD(P)-dependent oxidoreductase [Nocardioidaceae bacterium]
MSVYSTRSAVNAPAGERTGEQAGGPVVAVLGTGTMGAGMARNLAAAGLLTRAWNRTPARAEALTSAGIRACSSVAEAVDGADVVITMLWDAPAVEEVLRAGAGSFRSGAVLLQTSTVGVAGAATLATVSSELGLVYVDAPVLGTKKPAEEGALVVLASGPEEVAGRLARVLDAVGRRSVWVGEAGAGSALKLAANAFVLSLTSAVAQSLAITEALGLDPRLFLDAVSAGPLESPYLRHKGQAMVANDFTPSFTVDAGAKDAELILAATRDAGVDAVLVEVVRNQQHQVAGDGYGDQDMAVVYRAYHRAQRQAGHGDPVTLG